LGLAGSQSSQKWGRAAIKQHSVVCRRRPEEDRDDDHDRFVALVRESLENADFKPGLSVMCHLAGNAAANIDAVRADQIKETAMRNAKSFTLLVGGTLLALVARISFAQNIAPDALVKSVTLEVVDVIRKNSDAHDPAKIARLIEAKVLPHFDFAHMTRLAMGRNWRLASPKQQQALIAEFKTLLVHTYSVSLTAYRNQKIEFEPLRAAPGDTDVTVRSVVKQPGTSPIPIYYEMEKEPAGWKVYDVTIDGISLVITYRDTFMRQVREQGVDGLIKALAAKNHSNDMLSDRAGA
jgi:phospholipid transport system substrate-binding protein